MARHTPERFRLANKKCQCYKEGGRDYEILWCATHGGYVLDCVVCGSWFHTHRTHTLYCSSACSQKAYRERKKEALEGGI